MKRQKIVAVLLVMALAFSMIPASAQAAKGPKKVTTFKVKSLKKDKSKNYVLSMNVGEKYSIKTVVKTKPNKAAYKKLTFKSGKTSVATVSKKGVILAKSAGTAKVTVRTCKPQKGKNKKAVILVKVKSKETVPSTPAPTKAPEQTKAPVAPTVAPTATPVATVVPTTEPTLAPTPTATPVITPEPTPFDATDPMSYTSLYKLAENNGFHFGTVVDPWSMTNKTFTDIVKKHFNSVTAANEMKAYSLLNQTSSIAAYQNEDSMPVMTYTNADKIMDFAKENGMLVRGHALVWDASMSDWFFREGYTKTGEYVSADIMKKRLKYYIDEVVTHFEKKYPGIIYCWDVVNEAVDSSNALDKSDPRKVEDNIFSQHVGSDYVELAFQYTHETLEKIKQTIEPDVKIDLFYNDFNAYLQGKSAAICELVNSINSFVSDGNGGYVKLCDGVGMQSYLGGYGGQSGCMDLAMLPKVKDAILAYHALGVQVHVTELAVRNYDPDYMQEHADFYGQLFDLYCELNKGDDKPLTSISIWGLKDNPNLDKNNYVFKMNGPYCGIFDEDYEVKDAFKQLYKALGGTLQE